MRNIDYYRAVLLGAVVATFFLTMFYVFTQEDKPQTQPKSNFEVVDTYSYVNRNCSVIRYTTPSTTWEYFLDCKDK